MKEEVKRGCAAIIMVTAITIIIVMTRHISSDVFTTEAEVTDKIATTHSYYLMCHIVNDEDTSNQYKVQVTSTTYNNISVNDTVIVSVYLKGGEIAGVKLKK